MAATRAGVRQARLSGVTRRQYAIVAAVAALALFIGVGITVLVTSGDDSEQSVRADGSTTSSSPTTTLASTTTSTMPPTTVTAATTPTTLTPGTTAVIPTTLPPTTRPPTTTTRPPPTTTRPPATTTSTTSAITEVGISPTEIHLAVIADDPATLQGMTAWQVALNRQGGLGGRKIRLDLLDTGGTSEGYAEAVRTACDRDFGIVGSFSAFDDSTAAVGCAAIPDVPVEAVSARRREAPNAYAAFPRRGDTETIGPQRWLIANVDGCCAQYILVPDTEPERSHTLAMVSATVTIGFETVGTPDVSTTDPPSRYDELVADIEDTGATYAASGLGLDSTVTLREAAAGRAAEVKAWYCDAACYDASFLTDGGDAIEGQYVAIETTPFSDRSEVAEERIYVRTTTRAGDDTSYPGLRAYVAGTLFEQATRDVITEFGDDGITRVRLLDALGAIHDFTAGGIVGVTDVGSRTPTGCYVLLKVRDGRFVRTNPAAKGDLDCSPENLVEIGD